MNDVEAVERRVVEMAQLAASRVDDIGLLAFRAGAVRRLELYGDHPWIRRWLALADEGPTAVRAALLDPSDFGRVMRSFAPLRTLISRSERDQIMARIIDDLADST